MGGHFDAIGFPVVDTGHYISLGEQAISMAINQNTIIPVQREETDFTIFEWDVGHGIMVNTVVTGRKEVRKTLLTYPSFKDDCSMDLVVSSTHIREETVGGHINGSPFEAGNTGPSPALSIEIANVLQSHAWDVKPNDKIGLSLAGLGYKGRIAQPESMKRPNPRQDLPVKELEYGYMGCIFPMNSIVPGGSEKAAVPSPADFQVRGKILEYLDFRNPVTMQKLVKMTIDTFAIPLVLVMNRIDLEGSYSEGAYFNGLIWLQGYIHRHINLPRLCDIF